MVKREGEEQMKGGWRNDTRRDGRKAVDKRKRANSHPEEMRRRGGRGDV